MPANSLSLQGKTAVMTGATSGIGEAAALRLAEAGAKLVFVARDRGRAEALLHRLERAGPGAGHSYRLADLSSLAEMKRVGAEIAAAEPRVDVLVNNAGAMFTSRQEMADGFERTFATNHLAYFVLVAALRDRLVASAPARIVNTASDAHRAAKLDWSDLQSKRRYSPFGAYCRSKLYNILFTRELARRLAGTGVTANCLHPGFVASRFGDNNPGLARLAIGTLKTLFAISPERGAQTLVHLAASPEVEGFTGGFFAKSKPAATTKIAADPDAARRLWDLTAAMTGLDVPEG